MCGINGFIKNTKQQQSENLIKQMNQAIIHRGPDDQGFFCQSNDNFTIGQGQVRLAIIDLSNAGFQPMFYDKDVGGFSQKHHPEILEEIGKKSVRIVFNGEIYNYQEIRGDLINKGYIFSSNSDTEVILASYMEYGADCVNHFNGMRAFAIYDPKKQEMFCSRDRLGKKPFYYYFDDQQFIFSSEIKGILEHKELNINTKENIDPEALDFYFTTGYIPAPWTIYKNIKKLEARHSIQLTTNSEQLTIKNHCYYQIPEYTPTYNKQQLIEEGKKLLEESVKIRMFTSDVPVGAFLSGGLDSSSVVAEMTKWVDKDKLNTFSIGFRGKEYDESTYIHIVEKVFGTNHHHQYFEQTDFESMINDINFYYDEPFADYSNFPTMAVSRLAKKYVTVSLSGDGGDEIFGGYTMHKIGHIMNKLYKLPKIVCKQIYYCIPKSKNPISLLTMIKEFFRMRTAAPSDFYANFMTKDKYIPEVYKKRSKEKLEEILQKTHGNFTQAMIDFDLFYNTLADNFLVKTDRASMAQPMEIRSPFLDIRRIDLGRKIPTKWKVTRKHTKILMREIIKDIVPYPIIHRAKQGFEPPLDKRIDGYTQGADKQMEILDTLHIDKWKEFYIKIFNGKYSNKLFNIYKIRLFLINKRYEKWVK